MGFPVAKLTDSLIALLLSLYFGEQTRKDGTFKYEILADYLVSTYFQFVLHSLIVFVHFICATSFITARKMESYAETIKKDCDKVISLSYKE